MLFEISLQGEEPIYQQIKAQIILGIASGQLDPGEMLPSVRQLSEEVGVNMMTISKAYNALKEAGYLITDRRKGTMVTLPSPFTDSEEHHYQKQLKLLLAEASLRHQNPEAILREVQQILTAFAESRDFS